MFTFCSIIYQKVNHGFLCYLVPLQNKKLNYQKNPILSLTHSKFGRHPPSRMLMKNKNYVRDPKPGNWGHNCERVENVRNLTIFLLDCSIFVNPPQQRGPSLIISILRVHGVFRIFSALSWKIALGAKKINLRFSGRFAATASRAAPSAASEAFWSARHAPRTLRWSNCPAAWHPEIRTRGTCPVPSHARAQTSLAPSTYLANGARGADGFVPVVGARVVGARVVGLQRRFAG